MDWRVTFERLQALVGRPLKSISGKTDITVVSVDADLIVVKGQSGKRSRPCDELRRIVEKMDVGQPIHVDSVLFGSGSSRNQPETIIANMPDVEWLNLNARKHIVWVGRQTHEIGTLKEIDDFEAAQIRLRFRGQGALTGRRPTTLLVRAKDALKASDLIAAVLQTSVPQPIAGTAGYRISHSGGELILAHVPQMPGSMELIPVLKVVDQNEAVNRIRELFPDLTVEQINLDQEFRIVRAANGIVLALE